MAEGERQHRQGDVRRIAPYVTATRYVAALPVVLLVLAALGAFVYGAALFVDETRRIVDHPFPIGRNVGYFVVLIDILLVGATLLIAAFGFYELFVVRRSADEESNDPRNEGGGEVTGDSLLPHWLVMRDLNDLKVRVVSMLVLIAGVTFVDEVVDFRSGRDVMYLGVGIATVIVALTAFARFGAKEH